VLWGLAEDVAHVWLGLFGLQLAGGHGGWPLLFLLGQVDSVVTAGLSGEFKESAQHEETVGD
jgi:hypothetical protein